MSPDQIMAVIDRKRDTHPELGATLQWSGLQRILAREGVSVVISDLPRPAQLAQYAGRWAIVLDRASGRHLYHAAHELGHLWLHHDGTSERHERVYNMDISEGPDPREDDAEVFATFVLLGMRGISS